MCATAHYSWSFFLYFSMAIYVFSCWTFFILYHLHVAFFCVVIFSCCTCLRVALFFVLHYFMLLFNKLQCSRFASFYCCTLRMFHFFPVALYSCCTISRGVEPGPSQTSKMESFATVINKVVNYCYKALHLRCSQGPGYVSTISMLHFFHVALF